MSDGGYDFMSGYLAGNADSGGNRGGLGNVGDLAELLIVAGLFGGGGWGFGGGWGNGGGGAAMLNGVATRADINEGFALQGINSGIQAIQNGLCDGFHNLTVGMMTGFNGVQMGFNEIGHQISDCCCTTQRAIDGINFNLAKGLCELGTAINMQTRDIIDNQNANYRATMDYLVQKDMAEKDARIAELSNMVSQANQNNVIRAAIDASTAEIIRRTGHDYPSPSYLVQPPTTINFPTNGCGQVQFGGNCGYGCAA